MYETYDIHFKKDSKSTCMGLKVSPSEAVNYINNNNGTDNGYFKDYKEGIVSVVCNETSDLIYFEKVK